jgi:hypothetical protein
MSSNKAIKSILWGFCGSGCYITLHYALKAVGAYVLNVLKNQLLIFRVDNF